MLDIVLVYPAKQILLLWWSGKVLENGNVQALINTTASQWDLLDCLNLTLCHSIFSVSCAFGGVLLIVKWGNIKFCFNIFSICFLCVEFCGNFCVPDLFRPWAEQVTPPPPCPKQQNKTKNMQIMCFQTSCSFQVWLWELRHAPV